MRITVVTASLNSAGTIADCLRSVERQTHPDVEHIVVDGGSTDGTLDILRSAPRLARLTSEPDEGFYDAVNKGIAAATGDYIATLNADDYYAHERVLADVAETLETTRADCLYGDLVYVDPVDTSRVLRYWISGPYRPGAFRSRGWMPPHPTFFARHRLFETWGGFDTSFRIAADYELMLRFLERARARSAYLPEVLVVMRSGGASNARWRAIALNILEDWRAWRTNGLQPSLFTIAMKKLSKLPQFLRAGRRPGSPDAPPHR